MRLHSVIVTFFACSHLIVVQAFGFVSVPASSISPGRYQDEIGREVPANGSSVKDDEETRIEENASFAPKVIARGAWSPIVKDHLERALRARLVLAQVNHADGARELPVFVELQCVSEAIHQPINLYLDMSRRDPRGEGKSGLTCRCLDADGKEIPIAPMAFSGAVPLSFWTPLSHQASLSVRSSPYGIRRRDASMIVPTLGQSWKIADGFPEGVQLEGEFWINPPQADDAEEFDIWRGKLELPALTVPTQFVQ